MKCFSSTGKVSIARRIRSRGVTGSMLASFAAALPIYGLTGSKSEAQNFGLSLFADLSSAITGFQLEVKGEENAWAQRPAVFIFNHQSQADLMVLASLVRRDLVGVGKQEIRKIPLIGKVLEAAGVVFIDRQNSASAIESMKPLVDVILKEGKSVMLAPEGTRSISSSLLPFKKGAFHLAMQARVPIVPVVIHNALDIQSKGDSIYHPGTVAIEVLPPVQTTSWTRENLERHIEEIRSDFLRVLGQEESATGLEQSGDER